MQDSEPIFELRNVSYSYPGRHSALADISMIVSGGESIAILGANGSGKWSSKTLIPNYSLQWSGKK